VTPLRHSAAHVFVTDISAPHLDDEDQHHLARVLRLRDGEQVSASDGRGAWRMCEWHDGSLRTTGDVQHVPASSQRVAVAFVPVKGDRPEWSVQKLTEIGVDEIIVLAPTRRAVVRWGDAKASAKDTKHMQKLQKVAREASMQSRRVWLPTITGPVSLADACARPGAAVADPDGAPLAASAAAPTASAAASAPALNASAAASAAAPSLVIIGPEGGFDDDEIPASVARVSLGGTILRAETATLVAATLLANVRDRKEASR
jgi:16S rRNA (uracil1498-N3)-methyltransferase